LEDAGGIETKRNTTSKISRQTGERLCYIQRAISSRTSGDSITTRNRKKELAILKSMLWFRGGENEEAIRYFAGQVGLRQWKHYKLQKITLKTYRIKV
jgi:hypothetical protein